jgi:hypothetical protein
MSEPTSRATTSNKRWSWNPCKNCPNHLTETKIEGKNIISKKSATGRVIDVKDRAVLVEESRTLILRLIFNQWETKPLTYIVHRNFSAANVIGETQFTMRRFKMCSGFSFKCMTFSFCRSPNLAHLVCSRKRNQN